MSEAITNLPNADEVVRLASGAILHPDGTVEMPRKHYVEVPSNTEVDRIVKARRKLSDLPAPPTQMNGIGLIIAYSLFGLDDYEIAEATKISEEGVRKIKEGPLYATMMEQIATSLVSSETENVRHMFSRHAKMAATKMVDLVQSDNDGIAYKAAADILDRAGHRPADVHEHRVLSDSMLTIKFIRNEEQVPLIDISPEE